MMISERGSISIWLPQLKEGGEEAVQKLWRAYFHRLVALAKVKLRGRPKLAEDEEDAALSAFDSFCRAAEQGRFPKLDNREDLWRLLVTITARKAADMAKRASRLKRGGDRDPQADEANPTWEQIAGDEPTPEFAAQALEEYRRLLAQLADDKLRSLAVLKMEGFTNQEIAARLHCSVPTVERRLRLIRKTWSAEIQ
jgi:RNA polymerase sigma factor (sigma-70 family)